MYLYRYLDMDIRTYMSDCVFVLSLCLVCRAASIQLRDEHCSFLRIDKDDFNRILHSVEANTVRFREYGRDVLVLEKGQNERYSVVSGTSEKMLEHLMDCAMKDSASEGHYGSFAVHLCCVLWSGTYVCCVTKHTQLADVHVLHRT